jgi:uncharacterized caspase-like protein
MKYGKFFVAVIFIILFAFQILSAEESPVTEEHISIINKLFKENGIKNGYAVLKDGKVRLEGKYYDDKEVDKAFSIAQTVVGVKWVSFVTPEEIEKKLWQKKIGEIFKRAEVLKPSIPSGPPGPIKQRYALVVGVGKFKYGIAPLQYATKDAEDFYKFLINTAKFPPENIILLKNESATRENIINALEKIKRIAEEDDLVVVYISTHGTPPDKFGGVHIVAYDTEVKPREKVWHTAVTDKEIESFVTNLKAKRLVMILDTCYSNGAYKGIPEFLPPGGKSLGVEEEEGYGISKDYGKRLLGAKDIIVEETYKPLKRTAEEGWGKILISASGPGEKSWESDILHNSIFTYYFIEGLKKNKASIRDAFFYAKPLVYQRVKQEKGPEIEQNPQLIRATTNENWNFLLSPKSLKRR